MEEIVGGLLEGLSVLENIVGGGGGGVIQLIYYHKNYTNRSEVVSKSSAVTCVPSSSSLKQAESYLQVTYRALTYLNSV